MTSGEPGGLISGGIQTLTKTWLPEWSFPPAGPLTAPQRWQQLARSYHSHSSDPLPAGACQARPLPLPLGYVPLLSLRRHLPFQMAPESQASKILWRNRIRESYRTLERKVGLCPQATHWRQGFCVTEVRLGCGAELSPPPVDRSGGLRRRWCRRKRDALNLR